MNGREHPWKPRTPAQIAEFAALWRNLTVPLAAIAKRYKAGERSIQGWRRQFGLPGRDVLARAHEQGGATHTLGAGVLLQPQDAAARQSLAPAAAMATPAGGEAPKRPTDPLAVPEIAALLNEIGNDARQMTAESNLRPLRRKLSKLAALASASTPHNWTSLHAMAQEQARALLWAEQCEAKLPRPEVDAVQLRKEVAGQMMRELKSALSAEDQAALAVLVQRGADVLVARGRTSGTSGLANGLPGSALPARNGKELPASSSRPVPG